MTSWPWGWPAGQFVRVEPAEPVEPIADSTERAAAMARLAALESELNLTYDRAGRVMDEIRYLQEERSRLLKALTA